MRRRVWVGFAGLCLLAGSAWVFDEAQPGLLQGPFRIAVHQGALALLFWLARRLGRDDGKGGSLAKIAVAGVVIFVVPAVLLSASSGHVSELTGVLLFMLVPVVVIFVVAQRSAGFGADRNPLELMAPALAALGGAALLIPFALPGTTGGKLWLATLVASAIGAAFTAVWLHDLLQGIGVLRAAAVICAASSVVAAVFAWGSLPVWDAGLAEGEALRCVLFDLPMMLLTVWLAREMKPVSFSVRLLAIPFVTVVEGIVVERPTLAWTSWLGLSLFAGGAFWLLRADSNEVL